MMEIAEDVAKGDSAKRDLRIVGNTPYLAVVIAAAPKIAIGRSRTGRPLPRDVSGQKRVREWHDAGRCRIEINARWPFIRLQLIKDCGVPRSDERRVGTESVSTCQFRWWPIHEKKKQE